MPLERKQSAKKGDSPGAIPETLPELDLPSDTPGSRALRDYKQKLDVWWRDTRAAIDRELKDLRDANA